MVALGKDADEEEEQDDEISDVNDYLDDHHYQETELTRNSDQKQDLYKGKKNTKHEQKPAKV